MPDTDRIDRAVADRIAAYRPARVPPFTAVRDARRRRRVRTGAGAALAAVAVAGVLTVPAVLRDPAPPQLPAAAPAPIEQPGTTARPGTTERPAATTEPGATSGTTGRPRPGAGSEAEAARQLWRVRGARSYTIRLKLLCFCPETPPRLVTVRNGRTVGAGPNVDDLFAEIASPRFDKVTATYDPRYGFPTRVVIDPDENTIDEEKTFLVTDYRPSR